MELAAARVPFLYVPLRHHFEQNVPRATTGCRTTGAGRRVDYDDVSDPEWLAGRSSSRSAARSPRCRWSQAAQSAPPRCWGSCCERRRRHRRDRAGLLRGLVRRRPDTCRLVRCTHSWSSAGPARSVARTRRVTTKERMLELLRARAREPRTRRTTRSRSTVVDVHHDIAAAVVRSAQYREYLHLLRTPRAGGSSTRSGSSPNPIAGRSREGPGPRRGGYVESDGVRIHYEVTGAGSPTILLLPTWTVVHKRLWKAQVPYLSRHFRVVTYDGPGNGRSDRPLDPAAYDHDAQVRHALAVLDATGTDRAVVVGLSQGEPGRCSWLPSTATASRDRLHLPVISPSPTAMRCASLTGRPRDLPPVAGARHRAGPASSTGRSTTRRTGATTTRTSCGSSSACVSPNRTRPSRSRTASHWGLDTTPDGARRGGRRHAAEPATVEEWCRPSRARCSRSTATTTWSARPRAGSGSPS